MRIPSAIKAKYGDIDRDKSDWAVVYGDWTLYKIVIDANAGLKPYVWASVHGDVSERFETMEAALDVRERYEEVRK